MLTLWDIRIFPIFGDHELVLSASQLKDVATMLENFRNSMSLSNSSDTPDVQAVITSLIYKYACKVPLQSQDDVKTALDTCKFFRAVTGCTVVIRRLVAPELLSNFSYVKEVLIPVVVPAIRELPKTHGVTDDLSPFLQTIMITWVDKILGPRPTPDFRSIVEASDWEQWSTACSCMDCRPTYNFLFRGTQTEFALKMIGLQRREHVLKFLKKHASSVATFTNINSIMPGLKVRCLLREPELSS